MQGCKYLGISQICESGTKNRHEKGEVFLDSGGFTHRTAEVNHAESRMASL
jgi:hypothetical protein